MARPQRDEVDTELRELVASGLEELDAGGEAALQKFLAAHPERADSIRRLIEDLRTRGLLENAEERATDIPERLGDFHLKRCLGSGGMGVVWLAEQVSLHREVAVKVLPPSQLLFPHARERFKREIETVARLEHPGIVPIYVVGEEHGLPYFAMERVDGCNLAEVVRELAGSNPRKLAGEDLRGAITRIAERARGGPPPPATADAELRAQRVFSGRFTDAALRLVEQVAEALAHAHARGVLHRDVKPSNVMVTGDGRARLVDFGLAAIEGTSRLTRPGANPGSLPYMSPEQIEAADSGLDARTDVYSLGVTLYELLTLRPAYESESSEVTRRRILTGDTLPPRAFHRGLERDVETVCLTAMRVERERRYVGAAELARDLECAREKRPISARRPGVVRLLADQVRRRPARALAAACLLLVVGGALLFQQWRGASERERFQRSLRAVLAAAYQNEKPSPDDLAVVTRFLPRGEETRALKLLERDPLAKERWRELEDLLPESVRGDAQRWPEELVAPRAIITDRKPRFRFSVPPSDGGARDYQVTVVAPGEPDSLISTDVRRISVHVTAAAQTVAAPFVGPPLPIGVPLRWSVHQDGRDDGEIAAPQADFEIVDPRAVELRLAAIRTGDATLDRVARGACLLEEGLAAAAVAELGAAEAAAPDPLLAPEVDACRLYLVARSCALLGDTQTFLRARTSARERADARR